MAEQTTNTTTLYRIENPNILASPDGVNSHEKLVGQWFSTDPEYIANYLRKATQTFGKDSKIVDGAQLVKAEVPTDQLAAFHAKSHPIAEDMDIEDDNYVIPRDGTVPVEVLPLDEIIGDLRGKLGDVRIMQEAKNLILGHIAAHHSDVSSS